VDNLLLVSQIYVNMNPTAKTKTKKMKNSKVRKYFGVGRKWVFTLALFLLVFAAASVVKIHAAGNVTGFLWGGTEEISDGNPNNGPSGYETGVGWISMSRKNCDPDSDGTTEGGADNPNFPGCTPGKSITKDEKYEVNIPSSGSVTGYAWVNAGGNPDNGQQNGIGWLDFNPQDHCGSVYDAFCTDPDGGTGGVTRSGNNLVGWARIVEIAKAAKQGNSGGWTGWVKFSNSYIGKDSSGNDISGIDVTKMDGTGDNKMYAWSGAEDALGIAGELGWIDFSSAKIPMPIDGLCNTPPNSDQICPGNPNPTTMTTDQLCADYDPGNPPSVTGTWSWTCSGQNGGSPMNCHAELNTPEDGQCGMADGGSFCSSTPTDAELCVGGTHPSVSSLGFDSSYEVTWTCTGVCSTVNDNCSAKGKKSCGWIETNP
jgi:hypothetical protein